MEASIGVEWDDAELEAARRRVAADGVIKAEGVHLRADQVAALLHAAPSVPGYPDEPCLAEADFRRATFSGDCRFDQAIFTGVAQFEHAVFEGEVSFTAVKFRDDALFDRATFRSQARFTGVTFGSDAQFDQTNFEANTWFTRAMFGKKAVFDRASFAGAAAFDRARFARSSDMQASGGSSESDERGVWFTGVRFTTDALFDHASFGEHARFDEASFAGLARFEEAEFAERVDFVRVTFARLELRQVRVDGDVDFTRALFDGASELGPVLVAGALTLDRAVFRDLMTIEVSASRLSLVRTSARAGATMSVRRADVLLDEAHFGGPTLLTGADIPPPPGSVFDGEEAMMEELGIPWWDSPSRDSRVRVVSVRRANVAYLTLASVDLTACRFVGSEGLDALRLDRAEFGNAPAGWHRGRWSVPVRVIRRQTLAEEHHWRARYRRTSAWYVGSERAPDWLDPQPPQPAQIAELYRGLRKGREDRKDEPGAADFYYGEMEMRRQRAQKQSYNASTEGIRQVPWAERAIIWLYWLLSGYGLRASRAFAALLVVIAFFAAAFHLYGFQHAVRPSATRTEVRATPDVAFPPSPSQVVDGWGSFEAWTYSLGTATAVVAPPEAQLTQTGRALRIALRILGPLLIGLGLLSIRGRVKR